MNRKLILSALTVVAVNATVYFPAFAQETAENTNVTPSTRTISAEDRQRMLDRMNSISPEDRQRLLDRMNNISPEEQQRLKERSAQFERAAQEQADKASEGAEEANSACEVVLCMFGKLSGNSQSKCKSAEKKYFSIVKKKKGKIRWNDTAKERLNFLNSCPSPENDRINKKFGKVLG